MFFLQLCEGGDDPRILGMLCDAYISNGDFNNAKKVIGRLHKPTLETCHIEGWLLFAEGNLQDALTRYFMILIHFL